ncbi:MAG: diacylglycerol kinase family lipid kinase [Clostridia bacterium]|nr:diacylglycerol kinase family lipid kinase [Clostridia bacterium]
MPSLGKLLLIINPIAGKMRAKSIDFPALFSEYDATVYYTKDGKSTEKYVTDHAAAYQLLVCVGGDGTLNRVVNGLMRLPSRPPLGYIPCGTTNDFATSLGIPKEIGKAAEAIRHGSPMPIDVGTFGNRYFTYVASFGAFSDSSYKASQDAKNRIGHMAYVFEAVRDIPNIRPCRMTVETESGILKGEYIFGSISNSTSLGGIMRLSPENISYDDGLFEVMLIRMPRSATDLQQIVFSLIRKQYNSDLITFFKSRHLTFSMDQIFPWSLDGEFEEGANIVEIKNQPKAIVMQLS